MTVLISIQKKNLKKMTKVKKLKSPNLAQSWDSTPFNPSTNVPTAFQSKTLRPLKSLKTSPLARLAMTVGTLRKTGFVCSVRLLGVVGM